MRRLIEGASALLVALFMASSANAQENAEPFYVPVVWQLSPLASAPREGLQQAPLGELLFAQDMRSTREVILESELTVTRQTTVTLPAGARLLQTSGAGAFTYCDPRVSFRETSGQRFRICLNDREGDGVFDDLYMGGVDDRNDFLSMFLTRSQQASIALSYSTDTQGERLLTSGVAINRSRGGYLLQLAVRTSDGNVALGDAEANRPHPRRPIEEVRFRARDLPIMVSYGGAEIEVLSIIDGTVSYTVRSTFDPQAPQGIGVSIDLPLEFGAQ